MQHPVSSANAATSTTTAIVFIAPPFFRLPALLNNTLPSNASTSFFEMWMVKGYHGPCQFAAAS
ncbi:hypothetical protein KOM00_10020 [Geomonas sp. Red69]|uniref:Uncharacterized protein n=1 Tax=Geomonas diazotrophica TaxID=2843197 RepID=A0ABX8JLY3_9BACT|nr:MULTISPECIES: hypothetical protein [Geomonas]MBU5637069.1 hypothetical protein [Geomonas diazotrophica]QWV99370.1 hypothetical protein KP005_08870 [Geomonas nitrogeniifigens]QXE88545.1 hypothetical protein KP003_09160 [Geomonas nitrogeniifigens]